MPAAQQGEFLDSIKNPIKEIDGSLGMRVIQNVTSLESGVESNVIIRNVTEPFWRECIDVVTKPSVKYRVCALGTPGIGKTTTTAYLIKMLLDRKETVVYRVCSENYFWEFRWDSNAEEHTVNVHRDDKNMWDLDSLRVESTFYIVDPGQTKNLNCLPPISFRARFILVSSPNEDHWGGH